MDFAFLPPEINSARMYTGPGPGSLLAAAGSWDALAAELGTTAETYESVVSGLTTLHWRGPASELMMATAAPYVSWLYTTAEQTRQTAMQAGAAATAFEQAYAMTVPPAVVTANRMQLMVLIATNFFGQNTAAIAATEAQYAEMWAQDAAAMSGYATASAAATTLTPFSSPKQTTNPAGLAAQTAAVAQADANAATADPVSSVISSAAQALPPLLPTFNPELGFLDIIAGSYSTLSAVRDMEGTADGIILGEKNLGLLPDLSKVAAEVAPALPALQQSAGAASGLGGGAGLPNAVLASVARANSIGPLSVPASWSAPSTRAVSALSPAGLTTLAGTEEAAGPGMPGVPGIRTPDMESVFDQ